MHKLYNLKYSEAKFHRTKGEIVKSIIIVGKFNKFSFLENSMDKRAWQSMGLKESDTTEQLNFHKCYISLCTAHAFY